VARSSQPWADCCNPVGIENAEALLVVVVVETFRPIEDEDDDE
jgi:hypothetical protein